MKPAILLALPLCVAFSLPLRADEIAPRAGEITLEGAVSALDSRTNTLVIQASKFTLATGQNRAIAPAKAKPVALKAARLLDAKGTSVSISAFRLGQTVRVTGREMGAGKSFAARVLSSTKAETAPVLSSTKELEPEMDEGFAWAAIAPLLPRSRNVDGVNLRVIDAGFTSPATLRPDQTYYARDAATRFGLAFRAFAPRALRPESAAVVKFNGLFAPDGTFLPWNWNTGAVPGAPDPSAQLLFGGVDPTWKSVRGEWEVMSGTAKPGASGRFFSDHQLEIPVPAKSEKTVETQPNLEFTTARGTKITLESLKRESGRLTLEWDYQGAAGAEDVVVEMTQVQVEWPKRTGYFHSNGQNSQNRWGRRGFVVYVHGAPDDAQPMLLKFKISEISRAWRVKDAFQRMQIEIPVASLLQNAPVEPRAPLYAPAEAQSEGLEAKWEGVTSGNDSYAGNVWLRDLAPDANADAPWMVRRATSIFTDQIKRGDSNERLIYSLDRVNDSFFHADNTLKSPNETSTWVHIDVARSPLRAAKVDLKLTVERAKTRRQTHRFERIPLPKPGETRDFDIDQFSDDLSAVRRVAWVSDVKSLPNAANRFREWQGAALLVTFDLTRVFTDAEFDFNELRVFDDKGQIDLPRQQQFSGEDPLGKLPASRNQLTVMVPAPYTGAPSFDVMFTVSERKWSGQTREVRLKDIEVPVAPANG